MFVDSLSKFSKKLENCKRSFVSIAIDERLKNNTYIVLLNKYVLFEFLSMIIVLKYNFNARMKINQISIVDDKHEYD